jgi:hypothetical protein
VRRENNCSPISVLSRYSQYIEKEIGNHCFPLAVSIGQ